MTNILSFSGGKDSTATLVYCLEHDIKINEIIYVRDWYPYPRRYMKKYFKYLETKLSIKITTLPCFNKYWINKVGLPYPSLKYKFCKRVKAEIFANYVKIKYGYFGIIILMGIRKFEGHKRKNYDIFGDWYWNKKLGVKYYHYYPIFNLENPIQYLKERNIKINPLYDIYGLKRLSCMRCIHTFQN